MMLNQHPLDAAVTFTTMPENCDRTYELIIITNQRVYHVAVAHKKINPRALSPEVVMLIR